MGDAEHFQVHAVDLHLESRLGQVYDRKAGIPERFVVSVRKLFAVHVRAELLVGHRRLINRVDNHLSRIFQDFGQRPHVIHMRMGDDPFINAVAQGGHESPQKRRVRSGSPVQHDHPSPVGHEHVGIHLGRPLGAKLPYGETGLFSRCERDGHQAAQQAYDQFVLHIEIV